MCWEGPRELGAFEVGITEEHVILDNAMVVYDMDRVEGEQWHMWSSEKI